MKRLKRITSALARHHRSGGHGIHSPFAFHFVLNVLRLRKPYAYYCYSSLAAARAEVVMEGRHERGARRVMPLGEMRLLFRVANYFNPRCALVIGARHGLSALSVMQVSGGSTMHLYAPASCLRALEPLGSRVSLHDGLAPCLQAYQSHLAECGGQPFVVVNHIAPGECAPLLEMLGRAIEGNAVVVVRHLHSSPAARQLWADATAQLHRGQTYTNGKMGILVAMPKLNPEHFSLWL